MPELQNWNRSVTSRPQRVETPSTLDELIKIVKDRDTYPSPVRPAGDLHSVNPCFAITGGTQVLMTRFLAHTVDAKAQTITVGAGVSLSQIRDHLRPHKLELPVSPEIGNATAGAVACAGSKDSSLFRRPPSQGNEPTLAPGFGQVGSAVTSVRMVDATGESGVKTGPALREVRSSYGLQGLIHEVTFRAVPLVPLEYSHAWLPFEAAGPPSIDAIFGGDAHAVLGFLDPYSPGILVERRRQAEGATITFADGVKRKFRDWLWEWGATEATSRLAWLGMLLDPFFRDPERRRMMRQGREAIRAAGRSPTDKLLGIFAVGAPLLLQALGGFTAYRSDSTIDFTRKRDTFFDFTFWAYPVSQWQAVVSTYVEFCTTYRNRTGFRLALFTEVYFIAADDSSLLSFAPTEHVFTLDMVHNRPNDPQWAAMNQEYNRLAPTWGGRPLLNQTKQLEVTPAVVAQTLPQWPAFKASLKPLAYERFCAKTLFDLF